MKCKIIAILLASSLIMGCAQGGQNQTAGTYIGAASGALLGSQFGKGHGRLAAVAIGAVLGSHLGGHIGAQMDEKDKQLANQTVYKSLETQADNKVSTWKNPNSQHRGDFVVTNTVEGNNEVCRDYTHTIYIDGQQEVMHGRACRKLSDQRATWYPAS